MSKAAITEPVGTGLAAVPHKSPASSAAKARYNAKTYTRIALDVRRDTAQAYKAKCRELGIPYSQPLHQAIRALLEDSRDLEDWHRAYAAYQANPVTYTQDEVEKEVLPKHAGGFQNHSRPSRRRMG